MMLRVPIERVSRVVLVGRAGATTPAMHALLGAGIPLLLVTRSGRLVGRLSPPTAANLALRRAQYRRDGEAAFCLELAQSIAAGKVRNQRTLARRLARRHEGIDDVFAADLEEAIGRMETAKDLDTVRGIEGYAARRYLGIYRQAFDAQWGFKKRTRRPPRDPINALLSLGYTLLGQNLTTALEIVGLDPYLGYFHGEAYGRAALALDLIEEFRTPIIDSLVLTVINHQTL